MDFIRTASRAIAKELVRLQRLQPEENAVDVMPRVNVALLFEKNGSNSIAKTAESNCMANAITLPDEHKKTAPAIRQAKREKRLGGGSSRSFQERSRLAPRSQSRLPPADL